MKRIFLFMLFITFTAFIVSGVTVELQGNTFDDYKNNVIEYAEATDDLYEQGFTSMINVVESSIETAQFIIDAILFIPNLLGLDDVVEQCVDFETLSFLQQINYDSTYTFWRLFNSNTPESVYQTVWATNNGFNGVCS